jgi:anti-sigma factor RsiW
MAARRDKDLQRYFDGELAGRRARKLREELERSAADQRRLAELQQLRGALREATEESARAVSFDGLWARVQVGIAERRPIPWGERIRAWLRRYGLVVASATAAAVLVSVMVGPFFEEPPARNDVDIESLEVDPEVAITIFTTDSPDREDKTTVIWVDEDGGSDKDPDDPDGPKNGRGPQH